MLHDLPPVSDDDPAASWVRAHVRASGLDLPRQSLLSLGATSAYSEVGKIFDARMLELATRDSMINAMDPVLLACMHVMNDLSAASSGAEEPLTPEFEWDSESERTYQRVHAKARSVAATALRSWVKRFGT
jgi:hypothetical protein